MDTQRYQWPGFKMHLLAELQRQQNQTQFCDILLQTEDISVPAHSCVLAALSPYLLQKLSAFPPPPLGQKRHLKLQALKTQTLLKLVGLLYSGELEVTGSAMEQNDVLSAVRQLGITELVEGQRVLGMKEGETQQRDFQRCKDKEEGEGRGGGERLTKRDAGVQSDTVEGREADCACEKRSSVSTGTQTDLTCFHLPSQTQASDQEPASSLPQCTVQTQKTSLDQHFSLSSSPAISSLHSKTSGDETPALNRSEDSVTNHMSGSAAVPFPFSTYSNSLTPNENGISQLSSEGQTSGGIGESGENEEEQELHTPTDEVLGVGGGQSVERRPDYTKGKLRGMAKLVQMQQIVEATQISIKVRLRRRTKEELWEVVNLQDKDETLAVLSSMQPNDTNPENPQSDPSNEASQPSSAEPGSVPLLKTSLLQHASTEPGAPHSSPTSGSQLPSRVCFTPNLTDGLQSVPLSQPPVEDTDEQIERMLEDIMMGLNILPVSEIGSKRSHHPQQSNEQAPTSCQIQHGVNDRVQGQVHVGEGAAGYWCYQDFGTQIGLSSIDTGQIQQSFLSLTSMQLDAVQNQQQQCFHQNQLSVTSVGQRGELSHQGVMVLPKSQASNQQVVTTSALNSSVHKLHHPECHEQSSQQDPAKSSHYFSVLCMDELRLPPMLSPLESSDSTSHQSVLSDSANLSAETQPQAYPQTPSWLTETPECLRFPLSAITPKDNESGFLPQDKSSKCWEKRPQKDLKLIHHSKGAQAVSCNEKEKRTLFPNEADGESNIKKDVKDKQSDTKADARKRKRKLPSKPDDSLPCKELKVCDGKKIQLIQSDCSVSLSSNNVLAKERDMANISSCKSVRYVGKPNELSVIIESQEIKQPSVRVRTRSFLRRPEEMKSNPNQEQTSAVSSVPTPRQKRGRPRKIKPGNCQESSSAVTEKNSNTVRGEPHINNNLSKDEESRDKTESKGKKRKMNRGKLEADPPKTTSPAESTSTANMNPAGKKPRRPRKVTLNDFEKLIKQQPFKTRSSRKIQDKKTNNNKQTSRKAGGEEKAEDNLPPDNTEGVNESHSMHNGTVDVNHNQIVNKSGSELNESQRNDQRGSAAEEVRLFGMGQCSVFSFSDLGEEVEKSATEREQPLTNLLQAQACDKAELDTAHGMICGDRPHTDPSQPQEDALHVDHSLMEADGCDKLLGCAQRQVDEDDEEVDVLLHSPDRVSQSVGCENSMENVDVSPEEDEDEDVKEVDVTGDEAD